MSDAEFHADDPRLTAYALGELDPTEREAVEQQLADSPAAQATVREIRDLAGLLTAELKQEPAPALTASQRTAILEGKAATASPVKVPPIAAIRRRTSRRWINQFAALASMAALVAVAAFLPVPTDRPTDRLAATHATDGTGTSRWDLAEGTHTTEGLPADLISEIKQESNGSFAERQVAVDKLRTVVRNTEFRAERLAQRDPDAALEMLERAQSDLGTVALDDKVTGQLKRSLEKSREHIEFNRPHNVSSAEVEGRNGELRETIKREEYTGFQVSAGLAGEAGTDGSGGGQAATGRGIATGRKTAKKHDAPAKGAYDQAPQPTDEAEVAMKRISGQSERYGRAPVVDPAEPRNKSKKSPGAPARPESKPATPNVLMANGAVRFETATPAASAPRASGKVMELGEQPRGGAQFAGVSGGGSGNGKGMPAVVGTDSSPAPELKQHRAFFGESAERKDGGKKGDAYSLFYRQAGDGETKEGFHYPLHESAPGTEAYEPIVENPFLSSYEEPLSTFGIDVDTASYANVRRFLTGQQLPPPNAVRIEELVNYFSYDYPQPAGDQPFSVNVEAGRCPWNTTNGLVRIGLKGREIDRDKRPASNLVFLVDVSGSMQAENRLPLVKMGLHLLTQQMTESDKVAIVTYSDTAVERLKSTNGTNKAAIQGVIESLHAGGSTNGAQGIQIAYDAAVRNFVPSGTNRVILCTDGDFNVGVTGDDELVKLIQDKARTKVFFSVLGFGMGNLKDGKLEKLADKGNGQYAYIDGQNEARKVFVDDIVGTLVTIAKDVKIQVEFNPNQVGAYRLIGYENRVMAAQDFNNDAKDAGDIGAGHTVTALYETIPAGEAPKPLLGDTLRYRNVVVPKEGGLANELLTVKLRYKLPEADTSTLVEVPVTDPKAPVSGGGSQPNAPSPPRMSRDFNWSAAVAAFGMILRDSQFRGQSNFDMVLELAQGALGEDKGGHRREFIDLVKIAKALYGGGLPAADGAPVAAPIVPLTRAQAEEKASLNGKYLNLLRIVEAPRDAANYGAFHDYGLWDGTSYAGQENLPKGHWVYVAPNWYIWGDEAQRRP